MFLCTFLGGVVVLVCEYCCHFGEMKPRYMDSQLPSLHVHFALSQPIYLKATLSVYFNVGKHNSCQLDNFTLV
jgi:hypothetical protein